MSFHRVQGLQWHSGSNNRQLGTEINVFSMSALGLGLVGGREVGVRGPREGGKIRQVTEGATMVLSQAQVLQWDNRLTDNYFLTMFQNVDICYIYIYSFIYMKYYTIKKT